jgi:pimeloyl-ACP methyl ester carboxylesterase
MNRGAAGAMRRRRVLLVTALVISPACGDGALPARQVVEQPAAPPPPREPPVHTGDGVSPQSVPMMAPAPMLPEPCAAPEVRRINRPASSEDPTLGRFAYRFVYQPPGTPGAPVLVLLPGGPGDTSMQGPPAFIPPDWGYLLTDPRGTGCNTLKDTPYGPQASGFFRTRELAADVVGALDTLSGQSYVLFGTSYGSVLGQTVAALLQERGTVVRAVVLEGVFGRAFRPDEFVAAAYIDLWDRLTTLLPDDVRAELRAGPTPYGLDVPTWSRALMALLPDSPSATLQLLAALSPRATPDEAARAAALATIRRRGAERAIPPGRLEMRRRIVCREIADTSPGSGLDLVLMSGALVRNSSDEGTMCGDLRPTTPFDSAALGYDAPVYFFIGEEDVAAPAWQGAYAFDEHLGRATRVIVRGGAHRALTGDLATCAPALLASIAGGGADLEPALAACPATVQVDTKVGPFW